MTAEAADRRVGWVDVAKGLCILLVVLMHATLGVEKANGHTSALHGFIEWARPFRMPDFFLISGLFLAARIDRPWRSYLDSKVVYFAYFYVLWLTIQFAVKAPGMITADGAEATLLAYLTAFVEPWGTLWFIYMLAVFFVTAKLLQGVAKPVVWALAACLYLMAPHTGFLLVDEFASRFVFFYSGYWAAPLIFRYAGLVAKSPLALVSGALVAWAAINWLLVENGLAFVSGLNLWVSYAGVAAVVAFSVIVVPTLFGRAMAYCGRNSIKIYLAFPLFMGPARIAALKLGEVLPDWAAALISTGAGVGGALILALLVQNSRLHFLFARPAVFSLGKRPHTIAPPEPRIAVI